MDNIFELNFGAGSRKCIGRNISWIEMMKVIPELLRQFRVELTYPDKEWQTCNHWFVQQKGVICNLVRR
jgi:cytochrome P450